jgi:cobalt/nickel transport system ATP-binding protein
MPDPLLRLVALAHRYPDGRSALAGVSFDVNEGETVAIVGPNGAGKTTLFLRLCGVLTGERDQISVNGLDPADPSHKRQLPASIGIVFQNPDDQLFCPTVFDDVAFGPLNLGLSEVDVRSRVAEALAAVNLVGCEERAPFKLSSGEKRRAAVATVLAMRPKVILFDEPTANLDPRGRREFIALLQSLPGTKLIATHDLDFVLDVCPRVLVLDGGQLVADGPARTILADDTIVTTHGLEVPGRLRKVD